ncbi:MAG: hypothetical protein AAB340_03310 [Patescibacteria group bacterium]
MRLMLLLVALLALCFCNPHALSQDKDVKKEVKKEVRQSLVEKLDPKSVRVFKKAVFIDVKGLKMSGKKDAESDAGLLNLTEGMLKRFEKARAVFKDAKEEVPADLEKSEAKLRTMAMRVVKLKADLLEKTQPLYESMDAFDRLLSGEKAPEVGYRIEWSPKGQWIVRQVKTKGK